MRSVKQVDEPLVFFDQVVDDHRTGGVHTQDHFQKQGSPDVLLDHNSPDCLVSDRKNNICLGGLEVEEFGGLGQGLLEPSIVQGEGHALPALEALLGLVEHLANEIAEEVHRVIFAGALEVLELVLAFFVFLFGVLCDPLKIRLPTLQFSEGLFVISLGLELADLPGGAFGVGLGRDLLEDQQALQQ